MLNKNNYLTVLLIVSIGVFSSCKKNNDVILKPAATGDELKDSSVIYSRDLYLWYNQVPATFNGKIYDDPNKIMEAIRQYSTEPGFVTPVDRWSFGVKQEEWNNISNGVSADFGLGVFFFNTNDLRVKSVEEESPAAQAGIHRGWQITKINGSPNIAATNTQFVVENVFNSTQTNFTFQKPDGASVDIVLKAATYNEQPIFLDTVYSINAKQIGYMVFNSFLGDTAKINQALQSVFSNFVNQNISDIIVDLRYNGGGYVSLQEKLADYLAPSSASGSLMMKQEFNDKHSNYNTSTNFKKAGALNLPRVVFIVTKGTASASELLINNLKPYMIVKLVGPQPTHGKPVGFFPIPVGDWYIFPVSFRTTNKNGEGKYFNGFPLNSQPPDGLDKDWGDISEPSLASALGYVTTGSFGPQGDLNPRGVNQSALSESNTILNKYSFQGAVGNPR
ncbi:MAG: S41 family peptidase [Ginsengibacter sp.]